MDNISRFGVSSIILAARTSSASALSRSCAVSPATHATAVHANTPPRHLQKHMTRTHPNPLQPVRRETPFENAPAGIDQIDWSALERLRARFLSRQAGGEGPYWQNHDTLAAYDATYAERIGWKWDALLRELGLRGWAPPPGTTLLDYGCGSGVAARRVLGAFGPHHFHSVALHDHSPEAVAFATSRVSADHPGVKTVTFDPTRPFTLVVSHVLNELPPPAVEELLALAERAAAVLWIEPGTHADSRSLATLRDRLIPRHRIIAPCTHRERCPLFAAGQEREWCHLFAEPPIGVQNNPNWVRFAQRAGVDLRSQAYSCLVLETGAGLAPDLAQPGAARALGRPQVFKPYARFLACDSRGLHWLELPKRVDAALVKRLAKAPPTPLYALEHDAHRISAARPLVPDAPALPDSDCPSP